MFSIDLQCPFSFLNKYLIKRDNPSKKSSILVKVSDLNKNYLDLQLQLQQYYLLQEPQKPDDALGYLKKSVGGTDDAVTIETLKKENDELKKKVNSKV